MKKSTGLVILFVLLSYFSFAQTIPFPTGNRDFDAISPWGYSNVGTNWDTSPFIPFIYKDMWYRLMPPNGVTYNAATNSWVYPTPGQKYPIILFFHGAGEVGTDNNHQLTNGGQIHRDAVLSGKFPGWVLFPQNVADVKAADLMTKLIGSIAIDPNRIYVHGLSNGAVWGWNFTVNNPTMVAAFAPMSGLVTAATTQNLLYTPIRLAQGGLDVDPAPNWTQTIVDWYSQNGGHMEYFYFPTLGHGTWDTMYNLPDFFSWFQLHKKNEIQVLFNKNQICPGAPIVVTMGFTPGFDAYEWAKEGVTIPGLTTSNITVNAFGSYTGRLKNKGVWTDWSAPVVVGTKLPTVTPAIQINGLKSIVLPAPDGSTVTSLILPTGYQTYTWKNATTNAVVGNAQVLSTAGIGTYKATVTEFNGCSSNDSPVFTVIDANGSKKPDPINGLVGFATSQTQTSLSWSDNPSPIYNETGFEVYRASSPTGPYTLLAITAPDVNSFNDSGLNPNTQYYYQIRPVNAFAAGITSPTLNIMTQVDAIAPTAPTNLTAVATNSNYVALTWTASTDNIGVYRYDVYKNGVKTVTSTGTSATVYNLTQNEIDNFTVKARDLTGNVSPASNQATAAAVQSGLNYKYYEGTFTNLNTLSTLTPNSIGNTANIDLSVRGRDTNIAITWDGIIQIATAGTYTFFTTSDDGSNLFIDGVKIVNNDYDQGMTERSGVISNLTAGAHTIQMNWRQGAGGYGMEARYQGPGIAKVLIPDAVFKTNFTLPGAAPAAPTLVTAVAIAYSQINVGWQDNSSNENGFTIYRSTSNGGPFAPVGTAGAGITTFQDNTVSPGTQYFYRVEAYGSYGQSGFSSEKIRGLNYNYYEQTLTTLSALSTYTPTKIGNSATFDITPRLRDTNIAFKWTGKIRITTAGKYTFFTTSDDGSTLSIDGVAVVANDYDQGMTERSGVVANLTVGLHDISVSWRQGGGGFGLEVRYQSTTLAKQLIPAAVLGDVEVNATTPSLPPAPIAPSNLVALANSPTTVKLTWIDNSLDETNFVLYRSVGTAANFILYKTFAPNTVNFIDNGLFANVTYFYKVVAINVGGSTNSNQVSATTLDSPPVLTNIYDQTIKPGVTTFVAVLSTDADREPISLSAQNLPSFATLSDAGDGTGKLTFNPTTANIGTYPGISVFATDSHGGKDTTTFKLIVSDKNPPVLTPISTVTVNEGGTGSVVLSATSDLGVQNLVWSTTGLPSFATLAITPGTGMGSITFAPSFIHSGPYSITVTIKDTNGNITSQTFTLNVIDVDPNILWDVNFVNSTAAPAPWNNVTTGTTTGLKNAAGATTTVGLNFLTTWWSTWNGGSVTGNNSGVFPDNVIQDYYYFGIFGGPNSVDVEVNGLDPARNYNFSFLGSSSWTGVPDNGSTTYTIGTNSVTTNVQNNTQNLAVINNNTPSAAGKITFTMSKAGASAVGYLNAMTIQSIYQAGTAPAPARALHASFATNKVNLNWVDAPFNEKGYDVYRASSFAGPYTKINTTALAANTITFFDQAIAAGNKYFYKVNSFNDFGNAYSNVDSLVIPNIPPSIIVNGNLAVDGGTTSAILLSTLGSSALAVTNLPAFATYTATNATSGTVSVSPALSNLGTFTFTATATGNDGTFATQQITVTVNQPVLYKILVNFNQYSNAPAPWNNTAKSPVANDVFSNLKDDSNVNRNVNLTLQTAFGGAFNGGAVTGNNTGIVPDAVLNEYYWFGIFNTANTVTMKFSGLSTSNKYNFKFVSSSTFTNNGVITNNGSTVYTIGVKTAAVNVQGNTSQFATIKDVITNAAGEVLITVSKGSDAVVGYVNGIVIEALPIDPALLAPSNLSAAGLSKTKVVLSWSDNSPNETGFEVYRTSGNVSNAYTLVGTSATDLNTFTDAAVSAGQIYYYKVRAILPGGPTNYSNVSSSGTISSVTYVNINGTANYDTPAPWNNLSRFGLPGDIFFGFKNDVGQGTGIRLRVNVALEGFNDWGMNTGNNSGIYPDKVLKSFWFNDAYFPQAVFVLDGLDQGFNYNLAFLGSIDLTTSVSTNFAVGNTVVTNRNDKNIATPSYIRNLVPDVNGEIMFSVKETAGSPYSIFSALTIEAYPADRPVNLAGGRTTTSSPVSGNMREVRYGMSNPNLQLYPNPVAGEINLETHDASLGQAQYVIVDMTGREIGKGVYGSDEINSTTSIDVQKHNITTGVYILKLTYPDGQVAVKKFIKN